MTDGGAQGLLPELFSGFEKDAVRKQQTLPTHVSTKLNIADLFTKAITEFQQFEYMRRACGIEDPGDS